MPQDSRWIDDDKRDLLGLAEQAAKANPKGFDCKPLKALLSGVPEEVSEAECRLDEAALELRRAWLSSAHAPADNSLKSPSKDATAWVPGSGVMAFGYERDLDVSALEERGAGYVQHVACWPADVVIFRSGQAALNNQLHAAMDLWGRRAPLQVAHAGSYFETQRLLETLPPIAVHPTRLNRSGTVDILIAEPVYCDGQFGIHDPESMPHVRKAVILDTTLVGPGFDPSPWINCVGEGGLVVVFNSGLKLDQAGLELANVGIVRVYSREDDAGKRTAFVDRLRELRGLTGSGLTLDEMAALSAPWFMDADYSRRYTKAIFTHNAQLAAAIGASPKVFRGGCHPSLIRPDAAAPFCALQLRGDATPTDYRRLEEAIKAAMKARGLVVKRGGSFGFRGHRFELIEPPQRTPFVRVALGWRGGPSLEAICELFAELARKES